MKHKILLNSGKCKICEIGDKVYMWRGDVLIAHYDGEKLYLTSSELWDDPSGHYNLLTETIKIPDDVPEEKLEQKILDQYEEDIDEDTRRAIDSLRL